MRAPKFRKNTPFDLQQDEKIESYPKKSKQKQTFKPLFLFSKRIIYIEIILYPIDQNYSNCANAHEHSKYGEMKCHVQMLCYQGRGCGSSHYITDPHSHTHAHKPTLYIF